ncbi:MAG: hypothetical protein RIQ94_2819 [Pseudomonadota bacterium]|jgi:ribosomal protein L22
MSSVEQKGTSVIQKHDSSGDNVGRDKIVKAYQSIAPEALQEPIELIFSSIREKKFDTAKNQLQIIKATNSVDSDAKAILEMVSIYLDLLEDESKPNTYKLLNSFIKNAKDNLSQDLCLATLIRLDVKSHRADDARERYFQFSSSDSYSQEVFYELIATADELENTYKEQRINLDEGLLNGLIRGAFRVESFELSLKIAERLNEISQSLNSKVLLLLATASNINIKLNGKHFWTITTTLKAEIMKMIDEVIVLINESKGTEPRLFNLSITHN